MYIDPIHYWKVYSFRKYLKSVRSSRIKVVYLIWSLDNEKPETQTVHNFVVGDLVWGPSKTSPAWPGKIIEVNGNDVSVKWFGSDKLVTKLDKGALQTLTEGLDAHHHARKKCRTWVGHIISIHIKSSRFIQPYDRYKIKIICVYT